MRALPLSIGIIHFVGIGGIGMSGIAEVLFNLGYQVQGSDVAENANTKRLRALGVAIFIGHVAENVTQAAVVVVSSAIKPSNPEIAAARAALVPVVRRAEMLAELMRLKWSIAVAGTHGKTTTTSLVAQILQSGGYDPTVINGGIINAIGTNAYLGGGDWMVVEADESDGTFVKLPATLGVVTNIDPEHLDFYGTFDAVRDAFVRFVENIPFYGFATLCIDHPEVQAMIPRVSDRRIITYGFSPQADVRAVDAVDGRDHMLFNVALSERTTNGGSLIEQIRLPMLGYHNVRNALAALSIGNEMGIPHDMLREALAKFQGVKRRFTRTGVVNGVTVIDDYGHHPVEIAAVLKAARMATDGKVIAVVQPHRYSRLQSLFADFAACFNDADTVIVSDVYAAGEEPIEGVSRDSLVDGMRQRGHRHVIALENEAALPALVADLAKPNDFVVCLGAGNITAWANALPGKLAELWGAEAGT
jgi:UDP-N-acetylmuramate--alanine ligase